MATSSITFAIRFRWWAKPALVLSLLVPSWLGFTWANGKRCWYLRRWLKAVVQRRGVVLTLLKDKDLAHAPQT